MEEIRRFLYLGPSLNLHDFQKSKPLINTLTTTIKTLISDNKAPFIITELLNYNQAYSRHFQTNKTRNNLECLTLLLAMCLQPTVDELFSNSIYKTLGQIAATPYYLFSFLYFRKFLLQQQQQQQQQHNHHQDSTFLPLTQQKKKSSLGGRGLKKVINRLYASYSDIQLLHNVTRYRTSHLWTNKDLFKLYHLKPHSEGFNIIFKYILFGYKKVKDMEGESEFKELLDFIHDFELLKSLKDEEKAVELIHKHDFKLEHLPLKLRHSVKIWLALTYKMSFQEFCELIHVYARNNIIPENSLDEKRILETLISPGNELVKLTNPIYPCIAFQMYQQLTKMSVINDMQHVSISSFNSDPSSNTSLVFSSPESQSQKKTNSNSSPDSQTSGKTSKSGGSSSWNTSLAARSNCDRIGSASEKIKDAIWKAFRISSEHHKTLNTPMTLKIAITVENTPTMKTSTTHGIACLSPLHISTCIILTMHYTYPHVDVYAFSNVLSFSKLDLNETACFKTVESSLENVIMQSANKSDLIEELDNWPTENNNDNRPYDAFVFLTAGNAKYSAIKKRVNAYRLSKNPLSKLVLVCLSKRRGLKDVSPVDLTSGNLELSLCGWDFDYNFIIDSFLRGKFF